MDVSAPPTVGINYWKEQRNHLASLNKTSSSSCPSLKTHQDDDEFTSFRSRVSTNLSNLRILITVYISFLHSSMAMIEDEEDNCEKEKEVQKTSTILYDDEKKSLILESRHALRYILSLFSHESKYRCMIQEEAVLGHSKNHDDDDEHDHELKLHIFLSILLSIPSCDLKCQKLAAKILCNLGTCNPKTSRVILSNIRSSPSVKKEPCLINSGSFSSSWGDMIHTTASTAPTGQRDALAAVAASLHNFIIALGNFNYNKIDNEEKDILFNISETSDFHSANKNNKNYDFDVQTLATDRILLCNLVRYILPKDTIRVADNENVNKQVPLNDEAGEERNMADDATLWISLLLEVLFSNGLFPQIYQSLGFSSGINNDGDDNNGKNYAGTKLKSKPILNYSITPEQIVLLNCFSSSVETYFEDTINTKTIISANKTSSKNKDNTKNPLGGLVGKCGIQRTVHCVAQQLIYLLRWQRQYNAYLSGVTHNSNNSNLKDIQEERYQGEICCVIQGAKIMVDTLGTITGFCDDSDEMKKNLKSFDASLRIYLGQTMPFLADAILELGIIIDRLSSENRGKKSRELVISQDDQHFMVGLVRIIGNLCYQCKPNQDLVRETYVNVDETASPSTTSNSSSIDKEEQKRSGLHLILSCTSLAYGCFTLREWGIISIRNILDDNIANQEVVAKLEAQEVINTPELEKLGVKLNLDKKGKVNIQQHTPLSP